MSRTVRIVMLLIGMMLFAQWLGLRHRIDHADRARLLQPRLDASDQHQQAGGKGTEHHSCTLSDAASLADAAPVFPGVAPLRTSVRVLALWTAFSSWDAPLTRYFCSRAPPAALPPALFA